MALLFADFYQNVDGPKASLQFRGREHCLVGQTGVARERRYPSGSDSLDSFRKATCGRQAIGGLQHSSRRHDPYGVAIAWRQPLDSHGVGG